MSNHLRERASGFPRQGENEQIGESAIPDAAQLATNAWRYALCAPGRQYGLCCHQIFLDAIDGLPA
jgi:hypothetical protein